MVDAGNARRRDAALLWLAPASLLPLLLLTLWAFAYPRHSSAIAIIALLALVFATGVYRAVAQRHAAYTHVALIPGSILSRLMRGRVGAIAASLATVLTTLPTLAYFALTLQAWEASLALLMALASAGLVAAALKSFVSQVRPAFRDAYARAAVAWSLGAVFAAVHIGLDFRLTRTPDWCSNGEHFEWIAQALLDLPHGNRWMDELFSLFRGAEASAWCFRLPNGLEWPRIVFILLQSGLVYFGLAALIASFQYLAFDMRRIRGAGSSGGV